MAVQQGKLNPVNTGISFEGINSDLATPANRIFHNGTDLVKCEFQTLRPESAYHFLTASPLGSGVFNGPFNDPIAVPAYIDRDFSSGSGGAGGYHLAVEYPTTIKTQQIKFYSTSFFGNLNNGEVEVAISKDFGSVESQASLLPVSVGSKSFVFRSDLSPQQFEYTVTFSAEEEGRSWFITLYNSASKEVIFLDGITEIIPKPVPDPQISYYRVDGEAASRYSMQEGNLLDMCYEKDSGKYYTIRFNDTGIGGTDLGPDDDFSTPVGSTSFNPIRWTEDAVDSSFIRSTLNDRLVFSTSDGSGRLTSNYVVTGNYETELDYEVGTLDSESSFFDIRALDSASRRLKYAVGISHREEEDVYYSASVKNFVNNTTSADLLSLQPDLSNVYQGSENWTVTYVSASGHWEVEGQHTGPRDPAMTGELYSAPGISFQISANSQQNNNDSFTFTVDYQETERLTSSGTLDFSREDGVYSTNINPDWTGTVSATDDRIQIYGTTQSPINLFGDNFDLTPDEASVYPSIPVFTIEEVNREGQVVQAVVEKFNVIKDPTRTYNDYIDGGVMLTSSPTLLYIKILNDIYTLSPSSPIPGLVDESTVGVGRSQDVIDPRGVYSLFYNETSGGFLSYIFFDRGTRELQVRTLTSTSTPTPQTRKVFIDVPDWEEQAERGTPYQFYWLSEDNNSLFYHRRHGTGAVNLIKVTGTSGEAFGDDLLVDNSKNFINSGVRIGDVITVNESSYASNGRYTIVEIPTSSTLRLKQRPDSDTILAARANLDYSIASNAELLSFNTDAGQSAFAAVNVNDFTLRAGTSDTSNVTAEVINAWGEFLSGKTVNFSVTQGDGAVSPPSSITDIDGKASTQYTAGSTPGTVTIKASITEV